ncbi:hypothetical protein L1887_08150 [Cichorium endivia]|nr:hypothetical protein L1887_08150 [Cichorium endivia]
MISDSGNPKFYSFGICVDLGILHWKLNPDKYEEDEELENTRGYQRLQLHGTLTLLTSIQPTHPFFFFSLVDLDFETFKLLQMLDYNVPGGKLHRGISVVDSYKLLKGEELTEDELFLS